MEHDVICRMRIIGILPIDRSRQCVVSDGIGVNHDSVQRIIVFFCCGSRYGQIIAEGLDQHGSPDVILVFEQVLHDGVVQLAALILQPDAVSILAHRIV